MHEALQRRLVAGLLALIVTVAAVVRFWGLDFGLPHTQARPDETYIIEVALSFFRGVPPPPHYDYPWLFVWLTATLYFGYFLWGLATGAFSSLGDLAASWPTNWEPFFLMNRAVSATLGTATVVVLFQIGRRFWGRAEGLVAALFLALAYLHARDSHFGTTDVTMMFLVMLAAFLLVEAHRSSRPALFAWAGLAAGLATAAKYNALLVPAAVMVSYLFHVARGPDRRRAARDLRLASFGGPFLIGLAVGVPFVFFDFQGVLVAMDQLRGSMAVGHPDLNLDTGWVHHAKLSLRYGIGLPMFAAATVGAVAVLVERPALGSVLLSFPAVYYAVAGGSRNQFFRYMIPMVPFLCLTAARAVTLASAGLGGLVPGRAAPLVRSVAAVALAVAVVAPSALSIAQFDRVLSQTDNRVVVADWFERHVPPGDSVLQSGSHYGHAQFHPGHGYRLWLWDRLGYRFLVDRQEPHGHPDWILVQESPLPSTTQDEVQALLAGSYSLVMRFTALDMNRDRLYDQQDAFFVPYAGFQAVRRPGPNFLLYRRDAPP